MNTDERIRCASESRVDPSRFDSGDSPSQSTQTGVRSLTEAQLADLQNLDVLMVPAGGFFTIDGQAAAALLQQLRPRIAILMHFRTGVGGPAQLPTSPAVAAPFPDVRFQPSSVTLTRATVPAHRRGYGTRYRRP